MNYRAITFICFFLLSNFMNGQFSVSGCSTTLYNGNYTSDPTVCESCTSYVKDGGGVFIYRIDAGPNMLWSGSSGASINCFNLVFAMQNAETNCDPSDGGGTNLNGCSFSTTMPVDLMWFDAKEIAKNTVRISWEVASESDNEGFEVERSMDGISFESIGFIKGRGDATDPLEYYLDDQNVSKGQVYYYRLKQIDFDGKFEHFNIVSLTLKGDKTVLGNFYPNPSSSSSTTIDIYAVADQEWSIEAFDVSGKLVLKSMYQIVEGKNQVELNISNLGTGFYFIKFENGLEQEYRKLSVQYK